MMLTDDGVLYFAHVETRRFLIWTYEIGIVNIKINRFDRTQVRPKGSHSQWKDVGKLYKSYKHLKKVIVYYETKNSDGTVTKHKLCKL